jgi:hypothetical protein
MVYCVIMEAVSIISCLLLPTPSLTAVMQLDLWALYMLGKCSTSELQAQLLLFC